VTIPEPERLKWRGKQVYRCRLCAYDAFDQAAYETHYQRAHAPLDAMEARRKTVSDLRTMTVADLKARADKDGVELESSAKKADIIAALEAAPKEGE
jgi:hypothetical protein